MVTVKAVMIVTCEGGDGVGIKGYHLVVVADNGVVGAGPSGFRAHSKLAS